MLRKTEKSPVQKESMSSGNWRKPALFALAGIVGVGLIGLNTVDGISIANAEQQSSRQIVPLGNAPLSFADLAEKVKPAVVSIHVKNGNNKNEKGPNFFKGLPDLPEDHPLNEFFRRFGQGPRGGGSPAPTLAQGSGFIVSKDGYVVTNNHVVDKGEEIVVTLESGEKYNAKLIGGDARTDLALLKIEEKREFPTVEFAEKPARVGDWVLAVGNPFGLGGTVTAGIVSAKNRDIGSGPYDYLQIDAAVNRGNSGGPTFNLAGEVVGVNTAIYSPSGGNVGIAFAVPAQLTKEVIEQLKASGTVSRGWLGVTIQTVQQDVADSLGLKKAYGAIVTTVNKGGPASKSDVKNGDVIIKVNGEEIKDSRDLARKIAALQPKDDAKLTVFRDGKEQEVVVKLGQFPNNQKLARLEKGEEFGEEFDDLGLSLAPASSKPGSGDEGVIITEIDPESTALSKGLKQGDIILKVGRSNVSQPEDVIAAIQEARKAGQPSILLYIKTGEQRRFVALPLKKEG